LYVIAALCYVVLALSCVAIYGADETCATFKRGDANNDNTVNFTDVTYISNWMSLGGPRPCNLDAADANDDGAVNVTDLVYLSNWLSSGGPIPPAPGPFTAGVDPTEDPLEPCTSEPSGSNTSVGLTSGYDYDAFGIKAFEKHPVNSAAHRGLNTYPCFEEPGRNCGNVWGIFENTEFRPPGQACNDGDKDMRFALGVEGSGAGDSGFTLLRLMNGSQKVILKISVTLDTNTSQTGCPNECAYTSYFLDYKVKFPTHTTSELELVSAEDTINTEVYWFNLNDIHSRWHYTRVPTETGGFTCGWVKQFEGEGDILALEMDITADIVFALEWNGAGPCDVFEIRKASLGDTTTPSASNSPTMELTQPRDAQNNIVESSKKEWAKVNVFLEPYYEWAEPE
jgi:hypothetical protein